MASAPQVREWAHQNGMGDQVKDRGRLTPGVTDAWNDAHPDDPYQTARPAGGYISQDEMDTLFDDGPPAEVPAETAPRPPRAARASRGAGRPPGRRGLFGRGKPAAAGKKQDKKPSRVSTEALLGSLWRGAAKLAAPLPPLHRTLRVQAPVAGVLLEDAVKGTLADTFLQPLARAAEGGKVVSALIGPPLFVTVISVHAAQRAAMVPPQPPHPLFMGAAVEGLRSSLMMWMDVAGDKFLEAMAREREFEDKYGSRVDDFIDWLLSPPPDPRDPDAVAAESAMYARAMGAAPAPGM